MYFQDIYVYVTAYVLELLLLHPTISAKSVSQMYDAETVHCEYYDLVTS